MLVAGPLVYDFQPMLLLDGELNLAVQYANGVGMTPGDTLAGGVGLNFLASNVTDSSQLKGKGTAEGGSLIIVPGYGVGLYAGLDHNFSGNLDQKIYEGYNGITASVGFSIATNPGAEVHVQITNTREAWKRNLKDTYKSLVAKIKK